MQALRALIPLAPLHQPHNLTLVDTLAQRFPHAQQIGCFDTAFHHTLPEGERRFALPRGLHEAGVQRYGFHGLSYAYIASAMPEAMHHKRVIVAHLGGGASVCGLINGQSHATSMGFSTLDGLMMGTRCGALDAGVVLHLFQQHGLSVAEVETLLYTESGLLGVSGISGDMQTLLASDAEEARQAIALFCTMAAKQIAAIATAIGGMDALIFTGGIGEHAAPIREEITVKLQWLPTFETIAMATDEEMVLARAAKHLSPSI